MRLGKIMMVGAVMGVALVVVGFQLVAQGAEVSPKELLKQARTLYDAHNYDGALKRLQQIKPADLGFFEKGGYNSLLDKTQKAVTGKAADEKAFADGKEALSKKRFGTAVEKLSQADRSKYLDAEKAGPAKGLLRLAQDGHAKALARARTLLTQAAADAKAGKAADARKKIKEVEAMDVRLGRSERQALADANKAIATAEAKPATKLAAKPAPKPAAKPAAKPAPKPVAKPVPKKVEPKKPAGPTAGDLYAAAKEKYQAGDYDAAQKGMAKVDRAKLGFFQKWGYDGLARDIKKAVAGRDAGEKALAGGKAALTGKRYTVALENLSQAASCKYLPRDKSGAAQAAYRIAKDEHGKAVTSAKNLMAKAKGALNDGKATEARKMVNQAKAMDVDLGWWARRNLKGLDSQVTSVEAALVASAAKPAPKPAAKPAAKPPAKPVLVAAAAEKKPAAKPAAKPVVKPTAKPAAKPAAKPKFDPAALAKQANRARAEDEMKLGDAALVKHEYQRARIHFSKAQSLWPDSAKARQGLDKAMKLLAEREEPLADVVSSIRQLERQRIIAGVGELLAEAERRMARAERPEDYVEAERPLSQANRTIDVAPVLSVEEQERWREKVHALRKQIRTHKADAEGKRRVDSEREAVAREQQRRARDRTDRQSKVTQLWQRVEELRKSMQFNESIEMLDRLVAIDPNDERALRWREDLLYLEAQARQVRVRTDRKVGLVEAFTDVEVAASYPGEEVRGEVTYLRYPDAKTWKDLSDFRSVFTKAVSAEPEAVAETRRGLKNPIDLDFEKTSLDNVLKYISEVQEGLNIVIDPDVSTAGIDLSTRVVDLKVKRVAVESVLSLILGADLGYKVESGYILVTTREKLQQNLPVVTYPVQDLVAQIPDFGDQAPRFEAGDVTAAASSAAGGGGFGDLFGAGAAPAEGAVGWKELVDIIQRTVNSQADPDVAAWSDEGGPSAIEFMNGLLIVTQTRRGHEKVRDLLEQLRRERAIMISVESRFCQVSDDFLQDITLDVDAAFLGSDRFATSNLPYLTAGTQIINQPVVLPDGTPAVGPPIWVEPAAGVPGGWFAGTPLYADQVFATPRTSQPIVVTGTGSNAMGTAALLPLAGTAFENFTSANEGGMVVSGVFLDAIQVGFLLRAIQADSRSTQLQAPRITMYNGQRAYISVSEVLTYIADYEPMVATAAVAWDPTVAAIPVGVTLDVRATVSADRRYVQMDLRPQLANAQLPFRQVPIQAAGFGAVATAWIELPAVRVQDLKTTVSVPDGGTLLLGGMRQFTEIEAETGVPVLSKVPILKRLFNNRATVRQAQNLLILIKPKIIIQAEQEHKLGYDDF